MGYSEVLCHICGVSFNIGRIRTSTEPRNAAWRNLGPIMLTSAWDPPVYRSGSYLDGLRSSWVGECSRNAGCMFAIRRIKDQKRDIVVDARGKIKLSQMREDANDDSGEESDDTDWAYESDTEEEDPLEYCSDEEALGEDNDSQAFDVARTDSHDLESKQLMQERIRQFWTNDLVRLPPAECVVRNYPPNNIISEGQHYPAWYNGVPYHIKLDTNYHVIDEMFPLFYPGRDDDSEHGSDGSFELEDYPDKVYPWRDNDSEHGNGGSCDLEDHQDEFEAKLDGHRSNHKGMGKLGYHYKDVEQVEHIAGSGCGSILGYSGHDIGAEEMRSCQTAQCLVRKPKQNGYVFDPLPDDEEFEKIGDFFLSGVTHHMPSRDENHPCVFPARHGCNEPLAENYMFRENELHDYAMPFHPSCLEVFKRASIHSSGKIDINGLTSWWSLEANYDSFRSFPRDPCVKKCTGQEWQHVKGTAHLAANPLYSIPRLEDIFKCAVSVPPDFTPRDGAFSLSKVATVGSATDADPFGLLPAELRIEVLDHLNSKDIASLRLASRTFCQIPVSCFQKLIIREMPWLWEAWPSGAHPAQMPYSIWTTFTPANPPSSLQQAEHELAILTDYIKIVKENMPELGPQLDEAFPAQYQAIRDAYHLKCTTTTNREPFYLPPDKTNYFTLYTLITRHWRELRGLQNRKRIWTDCGEILRRVDSYKEEGRIDENGVITEDLRDIWIRNEDYWIQRRHRFQAQG